MEQWFDSSGSIVVVVLLVVVVAAALMWRRRRARTIAPAAAPDQAQLDADYLDSSHIINGPLTGKPGARSERDSKPRP